MKRLAFAFLLCAAPVSAQSLFAPGAAQYPSPAPRQYLEGPVMQCVIATPCQWASCVVLSPCPAGTVVSPPVATTLPAPAPPSRVEAPIAPTPEPKEPKETPPPVTINVYPGAVTAPPEVKVVPKAAPKVTPKKSCPC
jgi:hypothetical protein